MGNVSFEPRADTQEDRPKTVPAKIKVKQNAVVFLKGINPLILNSRLGLNALLIGMLNTFHFSREIG